MSCHESVGLPELVWALDTSSVKSLRNPQIMIYISRRTRINWQTVFGNRWWECEQFCWLDSAVPLSFTLSLHPCLAFPCWHLLSLAPHLIFPLLLSSLLCHFLLSHKAKTMKQYACCTVQTETQIPPAYQKSLTFSPVLIFPLLRLSFSLPQTPFFSHIIFIPSLLVRLCFS